MKRGGFWAKEKRFGFIRGVAALLTLGALLLTCPPRSEAFSVLAHQAIVDQAWKDQVVPLIRKRFPNATEQDLNDARAYARGGSHLPDLGYFPLGSHLFTDLLHYVRTGDFVSRLIAEAGSPQEYAFALGVLAHYEADTIGHPMATNRAVPILYPELAAKFGDTVTYAQDSSSHLQTEFRFDVLQAAHRGEVPDLFEHSVEFQVPKEFLERVFRETYGLELNDLFQNYDVALLTYRWGFRTLIHETTGIAWQLYRGDIESLQPEMTRKDFLQVMSPAEFEQQFGKAFLEPGFFVRFVAVFAKLVPNVGPLARLPYKPLPENVRQLYFGAFQKASEQYHRELAHAGKRQHRLPNLILDTGEPDQPGKYPPADKAYVELLDLHSQEHFSRMPRPLADDMIRHFRDRDAALGVEETDLDRVEGLGEVHVLELMTHQKSQH
jgi:hypothetical protein